MTTSASRGTRCFLRPGGICLLLLAACCCGGRVGAGEGDQPHWAYRPAVRPEVPATRSGDDVLSPVDAFLLARLREHRLVPVGPETRVTLIRRLSLDLLGIPPTPEQVDAFVADEGPDAYRRLIDRLLASPRYGERWAVPWLDAARFADSNGYQRDGRREAWAWRDWVIDALNADMPFDRFSVHQLAGDLLPEASVATRIATGFHRGTMANVEAGTDPEEERVLAVIDRVNTTAAVWMSTTLECAQCHDHKYDPFSQREYYRLFAFFNSTRAEIETFGSRREFTGPKLELPRPAGVVTRQRAVGGLVKRLESRQAALREVLDVEQAAWEELAVGQPDAAAWLKKILRLKPPRRTTQQAKRVRDHYLAQSREWKRLKQSLAKFRAEAKSLAADTTLVMSELKSARETRRLVRGDFLDPAEVVTAGVPAVLPALPASSAGREPNRLDLARWLVDGRHPLTARVVVNRHWASLFGRGLVETIEDFGTRGARPSHPLLLDWLATELVRRGWRLKSLHRLLVNSAAYRRRTVVSPSVRLRDPENRWYARASRRRLPAELIRDNALAIAGLLSHKMHGPPVFPVQPKGVWNHIGVASNLWRTSRGEDLYRRGVYVYWRRTVPYPSFVNFDAPSREVCTVARSHSNTPLQALTLLNDPVYFEAAGALAGRAWQEIDPRASPSRRVERMFRLATGRRPTAGESEILVDRFLAEQKRLSAVPEAAGQLVTKWVRGRSGAGGGTADRPQPELVALAAWVYVANVILNLDEVITRE